MLSSRQSMMAALINCQQGCLSAVSTSLSQPNPIRDEEELQQLTAARGGTVFASVAMTSQPCAHGLDSVVMKERKKTGMKLGGEHWRNMEGMLKRSGYNQFMYTCMEHLNKNIAKNFPCNQFHNEGYHLFLFFETAVLELRDAPACLPPELLGPKACTTRLLSQLR